MPARMDQSVREEQLDSLPGKRFVRWLDGTYVNNNSKAVMGCEFSHEWASRVGHLLRGSGCPKCSEKYRYSALEREAQIDNVTDVAFVSWVDGQYRNAKSKAIVRCSIDGTEWAVAVDSLLNAGNGCPKCAKRYLYSQSERESQLDALPEMSFVRWGLRGYLNAHSKAVMRCPAGHEWEASVNNLLSHGKGCPSCNIGGFNPNMAATLYALRSECGGAIKVGISNDVEFRIKTLRRRTPFPFETVAKLHCDGRTAWQLERMFHFEFENSGFSGFDGSTEWLKFNPTILSLLRILGA